MKLRLNKKSAEKFLGIVPSTNNFLCVDGKVFSSLESFLEGLESMNDETFFYHSNLEKNDFSYWVEDSIGDVNLAGDLKKAKDKKETISKVKSRINYLKKYLGK